MRCLRVMASGSGSLKFASDEEFDFASTWTDDDLIVKGLLKDNQTLFEKQREEEEEQEEEEGKEQEDEKEDAQRELFF